MLRRCSGGAAVVLVLCALGALGEAASGLPVEQGRCVLSQYRRLDPGVLAAVQALRNAYEEEMRSRNPLNWLPRNCSFGARRNPPPPASCARLRHVARAIADHQAVLSSQRRPALLPGTGPTLQLLAAARRDIEACLQLIPPRSPRTSPRRPPRSRHSARRPASPQCHEAKVVFGLLRLLTMELKLVARDQPCA